MGFTEDFTGTNFRVLNFTKDFARINFRELGFTEDFAGINFRELNLTKAFAGIRESAPYKDSAGVNLTFTLRNILSSTLIYGYENILQ